MLVADQLDHDRVPLGVRVGVRRALVTDVAVRRIEVEAKGDKTVLERRDDGSWWIAGATPRGAAGCDAESAVAGAAWPSTNTSGSGGGSCRRLHCGQS